MGVLQMMNRLERHQELHVTRQFVVLIMEGDAKSCTPITSSVHNAIIGKYLLILGQNGNMF